MRIGPQIAGKSKKYGFEIPIPFSVIIPTYNRAIFLKRALESLVAQDEKDFEVIVYDDGSTDHTAQIVADFSKRLNIKYLYAENWGGPAKPRNEGIKKAQGEWISFLDADDWWYPTKLSNIKAHLAEADIIYHRLDLFTSKGKQKYVGKGRALNDPTFVDILINGNAVPFSSATVKLSKIKEVHYFSEEKKLVAVEDLDFWLKLAKIKATFKLIPKSLGAFWLDGNNITEFSERQEKRIRTIYEKYIPDLSPELQKKAEAMLAYHSGYIFYSMKEFLNSSLKCNF